ncbi:MAG TPA: OmpA family protein [Nevskiaceae bacterium]|nr:OmpA family protein [Nevskiaceae bacterium]
MRLSRVLLVILAMGGIGAGVAYYLMSQVPEPQHLEKAVRLLANDLRAQLDRHRKGLLQSLRQDKKDETTGMLPDAAAIAVVPFVDADSGEVVKVSKNVEQLVSGWLVDSGAFRVSTLTPDNLVGAEYVLFGVMLLDDYRRKGQPTERRYHIIVSAVEHKTRTVAAQSEAWIAESDLDYTPAPMYRDSPMFPRDPRLASMVAIARSAPGKQADREYYDSLDTNALIAEAESYFDIADYAHARTLFRRVTSRKDGQVLRAYLGLYRTDVELHDLIAAEVAFRELVGVGADSGLNTKFLFGVNSTDFVASPLLRTQYDMWTRQIGTYFSKDPRCIDIIGHSSKTGTDEHNQALSLARANVIRDKIVSAFPAIAKKVRTEGRGAAENIVGSGTDDERDALDRRVEVLIVDCPKS